MRSCSICGGQIRNNNAHGICKKNPECSRQWYRAQRARDNEYQKEYQRKWVAENHVGIVLRNARQRAKKDGFPFSLRREEVPALPECCPCCSIRLIRGGEWREQPSLDRIYPERGYVVDNVQWLCRRCNQVKSNTTPEELLRVALFVNRQDGN